MSELATYPSRRAVAYLLAVSVGTILAATLPPGANGGAASLGGRLQRDSTHARAERRCPVAR